MVRSSVSWPTKGRQLAVGELTITSDGRCALLHGPSAGGQETVVTGGLRGLREWVHVDDGGRYRPISGARTLRHDWRFRCDHGVTVEEAVDTVYPLALRHAEAFAAGTLRVVPLTAVLGRQQGMPDTVSSEMERAVVAAICAICVRSPVWEGGGGAPAGQARLPCPEPCSVFLSLFRSALGWEEEEPRLEPVRDSVPFAEFENPANALRAAYLAARAHGPSDIAASPSAQRRGDPGDGQQHTP